MYSFEAILGSTLPGSNSGGDGAFGIPAGPIGTSDSLGLELGLEFIGAISELSLDGLPFDWSAGR